jgi:glutaminyl-tRNA synthetase
VLARLGGRARPLPAFSPQLDDQARGSTPGPNQYEFARLALEYTVMSKRKLLTLVTGKHVDGWDDPRMPTIAGMRRRGIRPEALRAFCDLIGIAKHNSMVDIGKLELCVRDDLGAISRRGLGVLRPVPLTITNWAELGLAPGATVDAPWFPAGHAEAAAAGSRPLALDAELLVDADDVWAGPGDAAPPKDFQRLAVGRTVRLRHAFAVTVEGIERDGAGAPVRVHATAHPETLGGGNLAGGGKPSGVIHWVSAARSVPALVRVYDRLFSVPRPEEGGGDFLEHLSPTSLVIERGARVEAAVASAAPGTRFQFERVGYFVADEKLHGAATPTFNRVIGLRDGATASKAASAAAEPAATAPKQNAKAATRPKSKSPAEYRAEARERNPALKATYERALTLGLSAGDADLVSGDADTAAVFDATLDAGGPPADVAKWMINELPRALKEVGDKDLRFLREHTFAHDFVSLLAMLSSKKVSVAQAKSLLIAIVRVPGDPAKLFDVASPPASADLGPAVAAVLAASPDKVAAYRGGKVGLMGFFVGQVVKAAPGADPAAVKAALDAALA